MAEQEALRAKAMEVYERLLEEYGRRPLVPRRAPMHELISTMLSHRTNHANEEKAYYQMWERFGSWEAIAEAPVDELAEAIAPSNFAEAKAPRIKETVRRILERSGEGSIDFLAEMPLEEALAWLTDLPGVGIKTATLVLLFSFHRPVMPVDTHVHRVTGRIGLIPAKTSANAAHDLLLELLPPDPYVLYNFHKAMLRHGQRLCVWGTPKCAPCPMKGTCDWYAENRA